MKYRRLAIFLAAFSFMIVPLTMSYAKLEFNLADQSRFDGIIQNIAHEGEPHQARMPIQVSGQNHQKKVKKHDSTIETRLFLPSVVTSLQPSISFRLGQSEPTALTLDQLAQSRDFPSLNQFIIAVSDGKAGVVRGIYVKGVLALPVIQQPIGDFVFVSNEDGVTTEFQNSARHGVIGIIAHNQLSGKLFYELKPGDEVFVVYGDSSLRHFRVTKTVQYQRLERDNPTSDFIDLSNGEKLTSTQVFQRHYQGKERITLQTCLENEGILNWGIIFVTAIPIVEESSESLSYLNFELRNQ